MKDDILIERCHPVTMRKTLEIVDALKQAGIDFVPIPVLSKGDRDILERMLTEGLERLEAVSQK